MGQLILHALQRPYPPDYERFTVRTADGVFIHGVLRSLRGDPLLLFCHGLFASKNQRPVHRFVQLLARDFDVAAFDFRGHGESGGACTLGGDEVADLRAVVGLLTRRGYRTIVGIGTSLGGAVLLRYAGQHGDLAGLVTIGAFADVEDLRRPAARVGLRLLFDAPAVHPLVRPLTGVRTGPLEATESPLAALPNITAPLLIIHGAWDHLVDPRHARHLAARAADRGTLVILRRPGHVNGFLDERTCRLIADWLRNEVGSRRMGEDD